MLSFRVFGMCWKVQSNNTVNRTVDLCFYHQQTVHADAYGKIAASCSSKKKTDLILENNATKHHFPTSLSIKTVEHQTQVANSLSNKIPKKTVDETLKKNLSVNLQ